MTDPASEQRCQTCGGDPNVHDMACDGPRRGRAAGGGDSGPQWAKHDDHYTWVEAHIGTLLSRLRAVEAERDQARKGETYYRQCIEGLHGWRQLLTESRAEARRLREWKHVCVLEACCIENGLHALGLPPQEPTR